MRRSIRTRRELHANDSFDRGGIRPCVYLGAARRAGKSIRPRKDACKQAGLHNEGLYIVGDFTIEWSVNRPHTSVREAASRPLTKLR